jgi:rhomboid protease GluP
VIGLRIGGEEVWLERREWELWVQDGRIPPEALVRAGGAWVPVGSVPEYRVLRERREPAPPSAPSLQRVLFPRRGLSATEALILGNILVTAVLVLLWGEDYSTRLWQTASRGWTAVHDRQAWWWWGMTIFLHAGPRHLAANMVSLLAGAGAVEFLAGGGWAVVVYVVTGVAGMALSYVGHPGPPLSVGASGAVFGLVGCTVGILLRRHRLFTYRQRWKSRRVYVPLFIVLFLPSLLHADYLGHTGGLGAGLLLGLLIPLHRRVRSLLEAAAPPAEGKE